MKLTMNPLLHLVACTLLVATTHASAQLAATPNAAPSLPPPAKRSGDEARSLADVLKETSAAAKDSGAAEQERRRQASSLFVNQPTQQPANAKPSQSK